jgi:membrane protease YdiL (CAAX protease family)
MLILLLAAWGFWSAISYPRMKKSVATGKRIALINDYIQTVIGLAVFGSLAVIACGTRIFVVPEFYFICNAGIFKISVYAIVAVIVLYQIISSVALHRHNDKIPKNLSSFLPVTLNEKLIFAIVCLFAGVCEELVFRGFALTFMQQFETGIWLAVPVSAAAFGLMHLYQGISGFFTSFFMGILLAVVFAISGNLLLPVIIHILTDICVVIVKKEEKSEESIKDNCE